MPKPNVGEAPVTATFDTAGLDVGVVRPRGGVPLVSRLVGVILLSVVVGATQMTSGITRNVLSRVFLIRHQTAIASSFALDVEGRQYLVTAKHLVGSLSAGIVGSLSAGTLEIDVHFDGRWQRLPVGQPIVCAGADVDSVALPLDQALVAGNLPLAADLGGMRTGQHVYFVGFPYGLRTPSGEINRHFPFAFVKHGVASSIDGSRRPLVLVYIDGANNPGFSGGPVVFWNSKRYQVAGVVSAYRPDYQPVYRQDGQNRLAPTDLLARSNSGLLIATGINCLVEAMRDAGTGVQISDP